MCFKQDFHSIFNLIIKIWNFKHLILGLKVRLILRLKMRNCGK